MEGTHRHRCACCRDHRCAAGDSAGDRCERRARFARRDRYSRACRSRQRPRDRSTASKPRGFAKDKGMRAIVLKSHFDPTAGLALLARKAVPGIEVFGGIDLNLPVGGMNVARRRAHGAHERRVGPHRLDVDVRCREPDQVRQVECAVRARVAERRAAAGDESRDCGDCASTTSCSRAGMCRPQEALLMFEEGRRLGVRGMVATHGMSAPTSLTVEQAQQAASSAPSSSSPAARSQRRTRKRRSIALPTTFVRLASSTPFSRPIWARPATRCPPTATPRTWKRCERKASPIRSWIGWRSRIPRACWDFSRRFEVEV